MTTAHNRDFVLGRIRELATAYEALEHQVARGSDTGPQPGHRGRGEPPIPIRALSITQPWASLIALGAKSIETRSWATGYRGPLAIHATKGFPRRALECCLDEPFRSALWAASVRSADHLPRGKVVAIAELVDVRRITTPKSLRYVLSANEVAFGDFTPGRYAWVLANVQPLPEPIPARGMQRLWRWDAPAGLALAGGGR